ncbi:hypothetical protein Tco_0268264 [Tanacetum coccineum]
MEKRFLAKGFLLGGGYKMGINNPFLGSKEETKGGSSKAPTDTIMHKEDQQETSGPASLGVTSEERANPQLSSGMSAFNLNKPIYSVSFIIHPKSASGNDALVVFTAEADLGKYAPSDFIPQQQLEDLAKLVSHVQPSFKDLDLPKDDPVIVMINSDKDVDDEVHATENVETRDTSVPNPYFTQDFLKFKSFTEPSTPFFSLKSTNWNLKKNKAEAALLKAQPSFPNVKQLKELLFDVELASTCLISCDLELL